MGYIYMVTNDINNKIYIGQTISSINQRWKEHKNKAFYGKINPRVDNHFYKAIRKYGIEHFHIKEIEYIENHALLSEREQFWIKYYNSYEDGYNSTIGGEGAQKYDYQEFKILWDKGFSVDEIAQKCNCNRNTVYYALSGFEGWQKEAKQRQKNKALEAMQEARKIKIDCYNLKGQFLITYDSQREAAKNLNMTECMVSTALKTGGRAKEYLFVKHGDPSPSPYKRKGAKAVNQYDLQDNLIASFEALEEAALAIGKTRSAATHIRMVCNGKRKTAYGYKWEWRDNKC